MARSRNFNVARAIGRSVKLGTISAAANWAYDPAALYANTP